MRKKLDTILLMLETSSDFSRVHATIGIFGILQKQRLAGFETQKRRETTGNFNLENCAKIADLVVEDILISWLLSLNNYVHLIFSRPFLAQIYSTMTGCVASAGESKPAVLTK